MATLRFYIKPLKNGEAQIYAAFQSGNECPVKYLGYNIPCRKVNKEYKFWDKKKSRVRGVDNEDEVNKKITDWQAIFDHYISDCNLNNEPPDVHFIKSKLDGVYLTPGKKISTKNIPSLLSIFTLFLDDIKKTHKNGSYKSYKVIKHKLQKYQEEKKEEILVSHIDRAFYRDFSLFLMQSEGNTNATILRHQGKIATVLNHGIEYFKIKNVNPDYRKVYTLKTAPSSKFALHLEELATLKAHKPDNEYHSMILDAFLLACETGLRYSDIIQLQSAHIHSQVTTDGIVKYIQLINIKGDHSNDMPLSAFASSIVEKYAENNTGKLFHFHYSQSAGRALKKIFQSEEVNLNRPCEIMKIQGTRSERKIVPLYSVISFHMARNTYITRLLSANVPAVFVQKNVAHSDLKTTLSYARTDDIKRWHETTKVLNN